MAKMTIAQMRERDTEKLAEMTGDLGRAKYLFNSYYRLCALSERNLYLSNTEATCNRASTRISEEREARWYYRLRKEFRKHGLDLHYYGYFPSIVYPDHRIAFTPHFYG